jgi:hypothetical protein
MEAKPLSRTPAEIDGPRQPAQSDCHCALYVPPLQLAGGDQASAAMSGESHGHAYKHVYTFAASQESKFPNSSTIRPLKLDPESLAMNIRSVWRPREAPLSSRLAAVAILRLDMDRERLQAIT